MSCKYRYISTAHTYIETVQLSVCLSVRLLATPLGSFPIAIAAINLSGDGPAAANGSTMHGMACLGLARVASALQSLLRRQLSPHFSDNFFRKFRIFSVNKRQKQRRRLRRRRGFCLCLCWPVPRWNFFPTSRGA